MRSRTPGPFGTGEIMVCYSAYSDPAACRGQSSDAACALPPQQRTHGHDATADNINTVNEASAPAAAQVTQLQPSEQLAQPVAQHEELPPVPTRSLNLWPAMAIRGLNLLLAVTVCLAGLSGALGQAAPKPVDALTNVTSTYNSSAYLFNYVFPPKGSNTTVADTSAAFVGTGLLGRLFTMPPCFSGTVPHFHPNSAEKFIGVQGKPIVYVYNGGILVKNTLNPNSRSVKTHIAPRNNLHWFVNDGCEQAAILSILNPGPGGGPGFFGYFNPPQPFTDLTVTATDVANLIATTNATATGAPGAFALTSNCARRCSRKRGGHGGYNGGYDD